MTSKDNGILNEQKRKNTTLGIWNPDNSLVILVGLGSYQHTLLVIQLIEKRALRILRNIPKRMVATVRHQGDVESETMMKSAVKCLDILSRSRRTTNKMMIEAWKIYLRIQNMTGIIPQKFLDNDHNNPMRVETSNKVRIKGMDWSKFYSTKLKSFDQYYRHGGNWIYGKRIWKSQKKN